MVWPARARRRQIALPMPPMPPVTNTTRFGTGCSAVRSVCCSCLNRSTACIAFSFPLLAFDGHGHAHAAADAQRGEALLRVALLHFVQQRDEDAAARSADRVAERDRAAVHVHFRGVPAHLPVYRDRLGGESLVDLHEVDVLRVPARAREAA